MKTEDKSKAVLKNGSCTKYRQVLRNNAKEQSTIKLCFCADILDEARRTNEYIWREIIRFRSSSIWFYHIQNIRLFNYNFQFQLSRCSINKTIGRQMALMCYDCVYNACQTSPIESNSQKIVPQPHHLLYYSCSISHTHFTLTWMHTNNAYVFHSQQLSTYALFIC